MVLVKMWQKDIETMPRRKLEELQLARLKQSVKYCYNRVHFYRKKMEKCGIVPEKIKQLSDIEYLPFTTKNDLRQCYPFGAFAQPRKNIVRIQGSSGTTGKPTLVGYTKNDLRLWTDLVARIIVAAGVTNEDIAQISFGYGLFTGAMGLDQGLKRVGAMVVPMSSGNTERQLMMLEDLQCNVLVATPSYALYLSEIIDERGLKDKLNLRIGLFGSEGCSKDMRESIERHTGMFVTDNYGMSELIGPGIAGECQYRQGLHIAEDHFLPEIIGIESSEKKKENEVGELVMTSLTKEAMPIIRYRTGDITSINYCPCECGRTHARIAPIRGRVDDMVIVKGVNVFPAQIEHVLETIKEIGPHYMIIVKRDGIMDSIEVQTELLKKRKNMNESDLKRLEESLKARLRSVLGLRVEVCLLEPKSLERFQGKACRVVDLRSS